MKKITPEYIASLVNFHNLKDGKDWTFNPDGKDMRNLQVLGSARIFNLLKEKKIALLADEVGMGKTIQSLAVCAALWQQKPHARILVLTPREEIARNWQKEYESFISNHYRHQDDIVKSSLGHKPVRKLLHCSNLYHLTEQIKKGWGSFYVGKISSLSSLLSKKEIEERLESIGVNDRRSISGLHKDDHVGLSKAIAQLLRKEILKQGEDKSQPYFDLIIIDEAHYLRNVDGSSQRVNAARSFFGDPEDESSTPLAARALLLTATPNHSSARDIRNITSYFTTRYAEEENYKRILDDICIRRLRRLSKDGFSKYEYRHEKELESSFEKDPLGEMFFGLYQHNLARAIHQSGNKSKGGSKWQMMRYLEGVEFIPTEAPPKEQQDQAEEKALKSQDFSKGQDAEILFSLSKKYIDIFSSNPAHPKYEVTTNDLIQSENDQKAVVFVRRINSVTEISKRVISAYDKRFWQKLQYGELADLRYENLSREAFVKLSREHAKEIEEEQEEQEEEVLGSAAPEKEIPECKVLNLFRIMKNKPTESTPAASFRIRFTRSRPSIFNLFFSPGVDYGETGYTKLPLLSFQVGKKDLDNYYFSALRERLKQVDPTQRGDIFSLLSGKPGHSKNNDTGPDTIRTVWNIFWETLRNDPHVPEDKKVAIHSTYKEFDAYEKEALANFVEKGALLASEAVVDLYAAFKNIRNADFKKHQINLYISFIDEVRKIFSTMLLYPQMQECILHFRNIYTKVFNINSKKDLITEKWDNFNNSQPIYPYNADNKSVNVRNNFNTPFYPNFLVATSVLQEGVNLQFFCDRILHYGMAWTPGDNEQRIGRVDRMFSKIERRLEEQKHSTLDIRYPYLKNSIDEEHLSRFVKRKYREDTLIDEGNAFEEGNDFNIEDNDLGGWQQMLRVPDRSKERVDPYPAYKEQFTGITAPEIAIKTNDPFSFLDPVANAIKALDDLKVEVYKVPDGSGIRLMVDPTLQNGRKQPVMIEIVLDDIGTGMRGKAVYSLQMKTPLAGLHQYKLIKGKIQEFTQHRNVYVPSLRICMDAAQTGGTSWAIYMANSFPLFIERDHKNPLSKIEVQQGFLDLVNCADELEQSLFGATDLTIKDLNFQASTSDTSLSHSIVLRAGYDTGLPVGWKQDGHQIYLQQPSQRQNEDNTLIEKEILIKNHQLLYGRYVFYNNHLYHQVGRVSQDAQEEELEVLRAHLEKG